MKPLAESRPGGIRHVLRRALDGPVDLLEESEDNSRGRNATFEVVVGGLLAHAGLRVEFRENPDVFTAYADRPVVIQCKRPFKPESVSRNLFKAGRQLRKDLRQHHDGLAVIAMSFSRLFNAGNKLARFSTEDEMDTKLHVDLRRAADNLDGTLDQIKRFGVSAVFFHSATPAFIEANPGMVFRQVGAMIPVAANKNEISLLQGLSKLIKM
jgi:hypothetical protein